MTSDPFTPHPRADVPAVPAGTDLGTLEDVALSVAVRCARLIHDERPTDLGVAATKSSETDVVTAMDTASERLARSELARLRPGDGFFGEEGSSSPSTTGITWVVDPIDGTVNYLYGHPGYCVSVAAVVGDPGTPQGYRPVAAAVVAPGYAEGFVAHLGGGARLVRVGQGPEPDGEGVPLEVGAPGELAQTLLATGFSYEAATRAWQGRLVAALLPQVRDIRRGGSAALDLCWVAAGRVDAYAEHGLNPWDLAGGWLVVTEAGGAVTDLGGADPTREWTVAGSRAASAQLRRALTEAGAARLPG